MMIKLFWMIILSFFSHEIFAVTAPLWHAGTSTADIQVLCEKKTKKDQISACEELVRRYSKMNLQEIPNDATSAIHVVDSNPVKNIFIHHTLYQLKGVVALQKNDLTLAKKNLFTSVEKLEQDVGLNTLGAELRLVDELTQLGKNEIAIHYFELLIKKTKNIEFIQKYKEWISDLKNNKKINFSYN